MILLNLIIPPILLLLHHPLKTFREFRTSVRRSCTSSHHLCTEFLYFSTSFRQVTTSSRELTLSSRQVGSCFRHPVLSLRQLRTSLRELPNCFRYFATFLPESIKPIQKNHSYPQYRFSTSQPPPAYQQAIQSQNTFLF